VSYQDSADLYQDSAFHARAVACINEQAAQNYANQSGTPNGRLANGVLAGNVVDVDAIIRQTAVAPTAGDKATDDGALLGAVQYAWPLVANARYPSAG
jgi:hypothetical protein